MAGVIDSIVGTYDYLMNDLADIRTKDLPLMSSPSLIVLIVVAYLKFCTNYGPRFMKDRPAYTLKYPIMLYNIFQVVLSIVLVKAGIRYLFSKEYNFICDPVTDSMDDRIVATANHTWLYFFAKITELLDTIFFVFRKKSRQISTLHLFHHSIVVAFGWFVTKYFPVGPIVLVGTLNSFVHVIMYSYYFVAGLGPQYQKYLWWKRYLTLIQLIQFVIVIFHNAMALYNSHCNYPKGVHLFIIANTGLIFYMFSQFYYETYIKAKPKKNDDLKTKIQANPRQGKRLSVGQ
ncbi:elongation of very long chain fatty acids protein AAEL008004-like [Trichoplusia ni]|uniref:Elongation of very long chain fatty acids protein n=1 Tax=Trichoplusia ni TaxID=7111 RepID=A0A7E5VN99_TRINI|nr:elongation of very long chain fatty acids protein AAEL008004-like [Trichoplusia ni]